MPTDPHPARPVSQFARRSFLKASALGAAAVSLGIGPRPAPAVHVSGRRTVPAKARNVIFMVADGMSFGTLTLADVFRRQHHDRQSAWMGLFSKPGVRRGLYATWSADSPVTDSSASGSAWGCGRHIDNGVVNITPDGVQRLPILIKARQSGKATGVVTTTRVTHATPASFYANSVRRDWEGPIAEHLLGRGVDVMMGGGAKFVTEKLLSDHADVTVVRDRAALLGLIDKPSADGRLLGLFAESHTPFRLDAPESVPTLAEMTRTALRRLDTHADGFVMQIEGGRVDHAGHSNDAAALISEQVAFDDAIGEVLAFLDNGKRDDTLLIITSDHGNSNPGLTVYGQAARQGLERVARVRHSFEWITDRLAGLDAAGVGQKLLPVVEEATGIKLDGGDLAVITGALAGKRIAAFRQQNRFDSALGGVLANHYGISFVSGNHTSDYVEVTALGPGSESIAPTGHNVDLHGVMEASLGLAPARPLPGMEELVKFPQRPKPD
ncbi:MAG: alkaline phosphatase [Phycisphaerales bacterium]|nr:alkaline phosphatase [Phycisphaerales bacterium]